MKFISIFLVFTLAIIAGCGQSAEEKETAKKQAQLAAMQIENTEQHAVMEALNHLMSFKELIAEELSTKQMCASKVIDNLKNTKYVSKITISNDCKASASFKKSAYTPDLVDQTIALSPSYNKEAIYWTCSFSKKYKEKVAFLPSSCQ